MEGLKIPVGRPNEASLQRIDLNGYKISAKFKRELNKFFKFWDKVVLTKSKGRELHVHNMESFYGEILDKFEELHPQDQKACFTEQEPFKLILEATNLKVPQLFPKKEDNKDFLDIFLTHKFEGNANNN